MRRKPKDVVMVTEGTVVVLSGESVRGDDPEEREG